VGHNHGRVGAVARRATECAWNLGVMRLTRKLKHQVRAAAGERGRAILTRANYALGRRPRINKLAAYSVPYPDQHRAAVVISADLELAWAWRYARIANDPPAFARRKAV